MRKIFLFTLLITLSIISWAHDYGPKREFRGAWIHTVGNSNFRNMTKDSIQSLLIETLDIFEKANINAVIFQVRPQADAFYISDIEPWSRFLSGEQGVAPKEIWDPLDFMIKEAHKRGMELHAWCNPYRVTSNDREQLYPGHLYFRKPHIFKRYGKQLYFDPGEPESVEHTIKVIKDIVERYDIDAIHFDDYFYPYPIKFEEFHDDHSFVKYSKEQGFEYWQKADWRRENVNRLIRMLNDTIKSVKPWVRFGISPFGIHRNIADTPDSSGSRTNGLSNYDQLYADVPLWVREGWIDYNVPQIYWKIGHPAADYYELINWWNNNNYKQHLYIGQNISTFKEPDLNNPSQSQFREKMRLVRELENVHGNVWWPGWSIPSNPFNFTDTLAKQYQSYPALIPSYTHIDSIAPKPITNLKRKADHITWSHNEKSDPLQKARFYAVYKFPSDVKTDTDKNQYLVKIVNEPKFKITPSKEKKKRFKYVITAIDRCWNESQPSKELLIRH